MLLAERFTICREEGIAIQKVPAILKGGSQMANRHKCRYFFCYQPPISKLLAAGNKKQTLVSERFTICREEGIRTLDTVSRIPAFQASPFNHSGTSLFLLAGGKCKGLLQPHQEHDLKDKLAFI